MAMGLRREVLQCYKALHKARKVVFDGDTYALEACRQKINDEYKRNMRVKDGHSISELIQYSKAVENELRTTVIQAREVAPGRYEARITPETVKLDNHAPLSDCGKKKKEN